MKPFDKSCLLTGFLALISIALPPDARAQYTVESVQGATETPMGRGLFYYLPQNGIELQLTVEKTTYKKGIYGDYAAKLLGIDNYIKEEKSVYKIVAAELRNTVQPDPQQQFCIYATRADQFPSVSLSPEGVLASVNHPKPMLNRNLPDSPRQRPMGGDTRRPHRSSIGSLGVKAPFADLNVYEKYDTTYVEEWEDTTRVLRAVLTPVVEAKSLAQKAEEIANLIIESKKYRIDLLTGLQEVNYAPQTIQFMYDNLLQIENEYMESFTGIVSRSEEQFTFRIDIGDTTTCYPVAFFDALSGIVPFDAGDRELIRPEDEDVLCIRLQALPYAGDQALICEQSRLDLKKPTPKGIHYRQPQAVSAQVHIGGQLLQQTDLFVAQWGDVLVLPVVKGAMIQLDPTTGALLYIGRPFEPTEPRCPDMPRRPHCKSADDGKEAGHES